MFQNKSIFITGGTGSFGKEFCIFLIKKKIPFHKIVLFSRDEFKQSNFSDYLKVNFPKDFKKIRSRLEENFDKPAVAFPKMQFFTPDRCTLKTNVVIAYNKKNFPEIKLNGGGDLCLPTMNGKEILPNDVPIFSDIYLWNYDSMFKTKEVISSDRARFARAWFRYFNDWGEAEGQNEEIAFQTWFNMIEKRYKKHKTKIDLSMHPKYIQDKIRNLEQNQFGFDAFGLKDKYHKSIYSKFLNRK